MIMATVKIAPKAIGEASAYGMMAVAVVAGRLFVSSSMAFRLVGTMKIAAARNATMVDAYPLPDALV